MSKKPPPEKGAKRTGGKKKPGESSNASPLKPGKTSAVGLTGQEDGITALGGADEEEPVETVGNSAQKVDEMYSLLIPIAEKREENDRMSYEDFAQIKFELGLPAIVVDLFEYVCLRRIVDTL